MSGMIRILTAISISLMLYACGGGSGDNPWYSSTTDTTTTTTDTTTGTTTTTAIYLGSGSGASFSAGALNIGVTSLSAGGTTSVTATLADADGNLYQDSASVTFTSNCVASSLASITSPVTTSNGVASTTYNAEGCSGNDTITATSTINGTTRTANGTLTVQPAVIGSMQFVSATPQIIGLKGFGLNEVSQVIFRVLDTNGNPVSNQEVDFSLSTTIGGVSLPNSSDISDSDGLVRADVQSGTVSGTVRVTATLASNPNISTQSDGLNIGIGIADQNSMSLAVSDRNPEGFDIDGQKVTVTVHAADHFNNPVPDGTAVSFTTEGGQIQPQCLTSNGACSVEWTSSNPRPPHGRSTILATMLGEEYFHDANSNGVLDGANDTFEDMPEAFRDDNENGSFDIGTEEFLDFNSNGTYDSADGQFNGTLCCDASKVASAVAGETCYGKTPTSLICSAAKNIHVRASNVIVMAKSELTLYTTDLALNGAGQALDFATIYVFSDMDNDGVPSAGDQLPPSGTKISIAVTNGSLESASSITIGSSNVDGPFSTTIRWRGDNTSSNGTMSVSAVSTSGVVTPTPLYINLSD